MFVLQYCIKVITILNKGINSKFIGYSMPIHFEKQASINMNLLFPVKVCIFNVFIERNLTFSDLNAKYVTFYVSFIQRWKFMSSKGVFLWFICIYFCTDTVSFVGNNISMNFYENVRIELKTRYINNVSYQFQLYMQNIPFIVFI